MRLCMVLVEPFLPRLQRITEQDREIRHRLHRLERITEVAYRAPTVGCARTGPLHASIVRPRGSGGAPRRDCPLTPGMDVAACSSSINPPGYGGGTITRSGAGACDTATGVC